MQLTIAALVFAQQASDHMKLMRVCMLVVTCRGSAKRGSVPVLSLAFMAMTSAPSIELSAIPREADRRGCWRLSRPVVSVEHDIECIFRSDLPPRP